MEYEAKKLVPHDQFCVSDLFLVEMIHKAQCSSLSLEFEY